jgi:putative NADH-flavin reductase
MGESRISAEDFAVAFIDEAEKPQSIRRRMTVAY